MSLHIRWLGQAGFEIVSPGGTRVAIDPYLGDSCWEKVGFKRMTPSPVSLETFEADILLISHEHPDHLDVDLMGRLADQPRPRICGNRACRAELQREGLNPERMEEIAVGDMLLAGDVEIRPVPCDHGDQCVDPLGFLIDGGGVRVYFAGDTAYTPALLRPALEAKPDVALLPINGLYGNLGWKEAARLAEELGCKVVIPCHYGMFVEHGGDPLAFRRRMEEQTEIVTVFLAPGEALTWPGKSV